MWCICHIMSVSVTSEAILPSLPPLHEFISAQYWLSRGASYLSQMHQQHPTTPSHESESNFVSHCGSKHLCKPFIGGSFKCSEGTAVAGTGQTEILSKKNKDGIAITYLD